MRSFYMKRLCYMGIPMRLQYSITAIGTLVIQTAINGFGSMTVAGVTAAECINSFISCSIEAIGTTMAPYSGQNIGQESWTGSERDCVMLRCSDLRSLQFCLFLYF